jgi:hypothetical protein
MIKAKEIAMAEYHCPECNGDKIASVRKDPGSEPLRMILCGGCGCFLGVVNDTSQIKDAIRRIGHTLNVSTGL